MAWPTEETWLFGLDIGTTTTQALTARARVVHNCVTGRMELGQAIPIHRSPLVFTPLRGNALDESALEALIEQWIAESGIGPSRLFAGGAIVTGLAALADNAARVRELVTQRFQQALVVTADDPRLESWLAFLGSAQTISAANPDRPVINLDIGGGTTNPAWGLAGEVRHAGCYAIGARHVRLMPGTYRIAALSALAVRLFEHFGIQRTVDDELSSADVKTLLSFYVATLEAIVRGDRAVLYQQHVGWHKQAAFEPPAGEALVTLSGGVGELAYRCARGDPLPSTTAYGDLGIDLARAICASPLLSKDLRSHVPTNLGAATVCGLALHTAEISGTTLYLPRPEALPLAELPIVGSITAEMDAARIVELLELARAGSRGAAIQIDAVLPVWETVKRCGELLAAALVQNSYPRDRPLVLLVGPNIGKTLGQYATRWGQLPVNLVVIDELSPRPARFVSLGKLHSNVVPVSYYGLWVDR
jgi:ethanolamine utilization protein EutA